MGFGRGVQARAVNHGKLLLGIPLCLMTVKAVNDDRWLMKPEACTNNVKVELLTSELLF